METTDKRSPFVLDDGLLDRLISVAEGEPGVADLILRYRNTRADFMWVTAEVQNELDHFKVSA